MRKHIVLTNGRSGSNFLVATLNLHPQLVNFGEVLGPWTIPCKLYQKTRRFGVTVADYLNFVYESPLFFYAAQIYSAGAHVVSRRTLNFKRQNKVLSKGIKDFFINFRRWNAESFLVSDPDIAVIYLYRRNLLRRYLSLCQLNRVGIVSTERSTHLPGKLSVPIETLLNELTILKDEAADEIRVLKKLRNHRVLNVEYEEYFDNPESIATTNRRIFEFLGVPPITLMSAQQKILPSDIREIVANYDELRSCLRNTPYEKYLD